MNWFGPDSVACGCCVEPGCDPLVCWSPCSQITRVSIAIGGSVDDCCGVTYVFFPADLTWLYTPGFGDSECEIYWNEDCGDVLEGIFFYQSLDFDSGKPRYTLSIEEIRVTPGGLGSGQKASQYRVTSAGTSCLTGTQTVSQVGASIYTFNGPSPPSTSDFCDHPTTIEVEFCD